MADSVTGNITLPNGDRVEFTLSGLAMAAQMDKLIQLTQRKLQQIKVDSTALQKELNDTKTKLKSFGTEVDKLGTSTKKLGTTATESVGKIDQLNNSVESVTKATEENAEKLKTFSTSTDDLVKKFALFGSSSEYAFASLGSSIGSSNKSFDSNRELLDRFGTSTIRLREVFDSFGTSQIKGMALIGFSYAKLTNYADQLGEALKMGIGGGVMDFAINAKTAGLSLDGFNKALKSTGGTFVQLGDGATNGSREFARLVNQIRSTTGGLGLLGLSGEEQAEFAAQQLKLAVGQGFRGRQATEVVIRNSQRLSGELDNLANRTGRSVTELAQAAVKVVSDPVISNFIAGNKMSGKMMNASMQEFAAGMRASFGELGDVIAGDALKSAISGLPMIVTKSGQNLARINGGIAQEIERQAQVAARGDKISEDERQRLNNMIIQEAESRKGELAMFAMSKGPMKESAEQFAALAQQARQYNTEAQRQRRREEMVAKEFNDELRKLQLRLQEFMIPFLKILNSVNWSMLVSGVSAFVNVINSILTPIASFVSWIGDASGAGTLIGAVAALVTIVTLLTSSFVFFKGLIQKVISGIEILKGSYDKYKPVLEKTASSTTSLRGAFEKITAKINEKFNDLNKAKIGDRARTDAGRPDAKKPAEAQQRLTLVNIAAGFGTLAAKPLYVYVVNQRPGAPGGAVGGPGGAGSPGGSRRPGGAVPPASPVPTGGGGALPPAQPGAGGNQARRRMDEIDQRRDRIAQAAELRRQNPGMTAAEAMEKVRANQQAPGGIRGAVGKVGGFLSSAKGSLLTLGGGMALDYAAQKADESGHKGVAGALDVGSSALAGAGWGGMIGSVVPGVGTAIGAGVGAAVGGAYGLYKNVSAGQFGDWKSDANDKIMAVPAAAGQESQQNQMLVEYKKVNSNLENLISEMVANNMITAKGVNFTAETSRFARQTAMNQP